MEQTTGWVFDIKRFAVHDGPGVRTTVFLKGCPLSCAWCHNPESIDRRPQMMVHPARCIECGACREACPNNAHQRTQTGDHTYVRDLCDRCGRCVEVCYAGVLEMAGKSSSVEDVMGVIAQDEAFYHQSGGGATLSGGEPLAQSEFAAAILRACKERQYHTAIDTSGAVSWSAFQRVLPYTDLFLYDLKHMDSNMHEQYAGSPNDHVLSNLRRLGETGAAVEVRMPVVPGINDSVENATAAAQLLKSVKGLTAVRLLPFHRMAGSKYLSLGGDNTMPAVDPPAPVVLDGIAGELRAHGLSVITVDP